MNEVLHGLSYEDYDKIQALRAGELMSLKRSPAHYMATRRTPRKDSEVFQFGRLFHLAMENPERFLDLMKVEPKFTGLTKDGRESAQSGEAKAKRKAWIEDLPKGSIVLTEDEAHNLTGMIRSVTSHKILGKMVRGAAREVSIHVQDPETGLRLKCRPDLIAEKGYVIDYKSTRDARPSFFMNQIFSDRGYSRFYALSSAHYSHVARVAGLTKGEYHVIAAVEKEEPWGVMLYPLDRGHLEVGESHRAPLTRLLKKCLLDNEWPNYEEKSVEVDIPQWVDYGRYEEEV